MVSTNVEQIQSIIEQNMPRDYGLHGMAPYLAHRIARAIDCPEPFPEAKAPSMMLQARWECPCAARDVLLQSIVLPFDIDERTFLYAMRVWWSELKHEARTHLNRPKDGKAA